MARIKIILVFCFIGLAFITKAQTTTESNIEATTYRMYTAEKWDSLAMVGSRAIKNGTNYFYLSYRVGVAYFMQEKYRSAIDYFNYALNYYSDDTYALGYLYQSYIYSGRNVEARLIEKRLTAEQCSYFKIKKVDFISLTYGSVISDNIINNNQTSALTSSNDFYGKKDLMGNYSFIDIGLQHKLFKTWTVYHDFSKMGIDKYSQFEFRDVTETAPLPPSTQLPPLAISLDKKKDSLQYQLNQLDYYLNFAIPLKKNVVLSPAAHIIYCSFANRVVGSARNDVAQTQPPFPQPPLPPKTLNTYTFQSVDTSFINYVMSLSLTRNYKGSSLTPTIFLSKLNGKSQKGGALSYTIFPKKNLNLYSSSTINAVKNGSETNLFVNQLFGFRVFHSLWAEVHGLYGNLANGMENNGALVYNNSDKTKFRAGLNLIFAYKHIELSFRYQYIEKQAPIYKSTINQNTYIITSSTEYLNYTNHTLIGGIKWNF